MPSDFAPTAITLKLGEVEIVPLTLDHAEEYRAALLPDPDTMHLFTEAPASLDIQDIRDYITLRTQPGYFAQAIYAGGVFVGSSTFFDVREEHKALEIGFTWYTKALRGTSLNPTVKLMMIGHAIHEFGAMRVQLKTSSKNVQSQRAMTNIGLTREGTLRNHLRLPDGTWRDTVFFSCIPEDWPQVKSTLENLIATRPKWEDHMPALELNPM